MKLEELIPAKPEFQIESTGKTYSLRLPTIEDRIYWSNKYGSQERMTEIFNKQDWSELSRIAYRLLEDKSDFLALEETVTNDDGVQVKQMTVGPMRMVRAMKHTSELTGLLQALLSAFVASEPLMKGYIEAEVEKKSQQLNQIGGNSST